MEKVSSGFLYFRILYVIISFLQNLGYRSLKWKKLHLLYCILLTSLSVEKTRWKVINFLVVTNNFARLKLTPTKNFYQLFFILSKNQITETLKNIIFIIPQSVWAALGREGLLKKGNLQKKRQMSHVVVSYVCRKQWWRRSCNCIETDQWKPVSYTAADQSKLVSYTDSSSEDEDLHVEANFDEPIDLASN